MNSESNTNSFITYITSKLQDHYGDEGTNMFIKEKKAGK